MDRQELFDVFRDDINFEIYLMLMAYNELSLNILTEILPRSKSSLSRRLSSLEKKEIILSRKEKIRGVFAKYYRLNYELMALYHPYSPLELKSLSIEKKMNVFNSIINGLKTGVSFSQKMLLNLKEKLENLEIPNEKWLELKSQEQKDLESQVSTFLSTPSIKLKLQFLPESMLDDFHQIYEDFQLKIEDLYEKHQQNKNEAKEFCILTSVFPFISPEAKEFIKKQKTI